MNLFGLLGILSALLTLSAFIANEYGKLSADSIWYDTINFVSGLGLFIYAYHEGVLPFMLTNGVWALVSGIDVGRYLLHKYV